MYDFIFIHITEISIKSYACNLIFRPSQKKFSRISIYLVCQFLDYKGPIYLLGILKVSSLSIKNGFYHFFFKLVMLWSKTCVRFFWITPYFPQKTVIFLFFKNYDIWLFLPYLGQFLGYIGPFYLFGILKVWSLRINNGYNGFFQIREAIVTDVRSVFF